VNARDREDVERVTELLERLREPFPPEQIDKLPKPIKKNGEFGAKGSCKDCGGWHSLPAVHLDYVGHANLTKRLLDIDLFWSWEPVSFDTDGQPVLVRDVKGNPVGLWIRLTILGLTRLGYGSCEPKPEAVKELIGDALRNSAARFGVALDLWSKQDKHKASQDAGGEATTPRGRRRMGGAAEKPYIVGIDLGTTNTCVAYVRNKYNLLIGERMAERVKIALGSAAPSKDEQTMTVRGRNLVSGLPEAVEVSSIEIREAILGSVRIIVEAMRDAIDETPPEIIADLMEVGICLAGGGSQLKGLPDRLSDELNLRVWLAEDPMTCVARGAGLILEDLELNRQFLASPDRAPV